MLLTPNIQEFQDTMERPNLMIIGIEESEDAQLKGPVSIFNKIIEDNFPNLKKEMTYKKPTEFSIDYIRKEIAPIT